MKIIFEPGEREALEAAAKAYTDASKLANQLWFEWTAAGHPGNGQPPELIAAYKDSMRRERAYKLAISKLFKGFGGPAYPATRHKWLIDHADN